MMGRLLWPDLSESDVAGGWLPEAPALTSSQVLEAIARRHPMDGINGMPGRWVFVREVSASTGGYSGEQRFDAVAVGLVPSVKHARVVYEIKVSRGDWLRELRPIPDVVEDLGYGPRRLEPTRARRVANLLTTDEDANSRGWWSVQGEYHKWDAALGVSTEFWIAAPPRCVLVDELPPEAGLLEVRPWGPNREMRARIVRPAPVRDTPHPDHGFWAAVLRRSAERR